MFYCKLLKQPFLILSLVLFSINPSKSSAQVTYTDGLYWLRFHTQVHWDSPWSLSLQLEERRFLGPDRAHQRVLPELQLHYAFSDRFQAYASYLNFTIAAPGTADLPVISSVNEQRFGLAVAYSAPLKKGKLAWRMLNEYRLFDSNPLDGELSYAPFVNRLRNEWSYTIPLSSKIKAFFAEELHLNWSSNRSYQVFDQNRLTAGIRYQWTKDFSTEIDYIHWYQKSRSGTEFFNRHILRLTALYKFDF